MNNLFRYHPRLWIAVISAAAIYFCLPADWSSISRVLASWDCGVDLFLALIYSWMTGLSAEDIRSRYIEEDQSAQFILIIIVCAALLSVLAIVQPLATLKQVSGIERIAHIALAALTLLNSWFLVATMFTTHYADMFYSAAEDDRPLTFPGTPGADTFKTELEAWILGNYTGDYAGVRAEWSKGWGYTGRGAWTSAGFLETTLPDSFGAGWNAALAAMDRYDPARIFSNPFLDRLMPAAAIPAG